MSFISTPGCGVTSPSNNASTAKGMAGWGVGDGVVEIAGVVVSMKLVGKLSGLFAGAGVCVNSRDAMGVRVIKKGKDGRLKLLTWVSATNETPARTKNPSIEKARCARTVFC